MFAKYEAKAQKKLENSEIVLKSTISGELKTSVNRSKKTKGLGIIFGDRIIFTTNSQPDRDLSLKWKQLDPFEEDNQFGFTIRSNRESFDFFVSSSTVLD